MIAQRLPNHYILLGPDNTVNKHAVEVIYNLTASEIVKLATASRKWREGTTSDLRNVKFVFTSYRSSSSVYKVFNKIYEEHLKDTINSVESIFAEETAYTDTSCRLIKLGKRQTIRIVHDKGGKVSRYSVPLTCCESKKFFKDYKQSNSACKNGKRIAEIYYSEDPLLYNSWSKIINKHYKEEQLKNDN